MHLTQSYEAPNSQEPPDAAPNTQDAPDAAPNTQDVPDLPFNTQDAPDAAPNTQDACAYKKSLDFHLFLCTLRLPCLHPVKLTPPSAPDVGTAQQH